MLHAVDIFFYLLEMLILVRILLSWIVGYQGGSVMRLLYNLTEPILLRLVKALLMALIQMV